MPLALIVEDGTLVFGANSYATVFQVRTYNLLRGITLSDDDDAVVSLAIQAMDYLATLDGQLAGMKTGGYDQSLSWPRTGVQVGRTAIYPNYVPSAIIAIQCYLAGVAATVDLSGVEDTRAIIGEKIGPIETDYSPTQGATSGPIMPFVDAAIRPFLRSGYGPLRSRRV